MTPATKQRKLDLRKYKIASGGHKPNSPNGAFEACVMEAVAYVAGEPWSDRPECVSPVIGAFLRSWNDSLNDRDRQMLKPYVRRVIGTRTTAEDEETRAWLATDWLARECAPAFLRCAGLTAQAEALEKLAPILSHDAAKESQATLNGARKDAAAAWAAAGAAAGAAAWAAAGAAAGDAARAAAGDAAWAAAGAAAGDAAWAAAGDAARAAARAAAWAAAGDAAWAAAGAAAWAAAGAAAGAAARAAAGAAARDAWAAAGAAWAAAGAAAGAAARAAARAAAWAAAGAAAGDALQPTVKLLQPPALALLDRMIAVGKENQ